MLEAIKCQCGAVTVDMQTAEGKQSYSMAEALFTEHFPDAKLSDLEYCNCNHCVNHWGIDLCACGSGEHPSECENGFDECGTPMQELGKVQVTSMWR